VPEAEIRAEEGGPLSSRISNLLKGADVGRPNLEAAARAELDSCLGFLQTDEEWAQNKADLIAYVDLLRSFARRYRFGDDEQLNAPGSTQRNPKLSGSLGICRLEQTVR
jgi:hypothetical protein